MRVAVSFPRLAAQVGHLLPGGLFYESPSALFAALRESSRVPGQGPHYPDSGRTWHFAH